MYNELKLQRDMAAFADKEFLIADVLGEKYIREVFEKRFNSQKNDYINLTSFAVTLKVRSLAWCEKYKYKKLYSDLFRETRNYALNNFTREELNYFFKETKNINDVDFIAHETDFWEVFQRLNGESR